MKKITLHNDFHGTSVILHVIAEDNTLSKRQLRRADKELCGRSDCCCGGIHRADPELGGLYDSIRHDSWFDRVMVPHHLLAD